MSDPVLSLDGASKDYGDGLGLRPVHMSVDVGELVMLVGHNGSGKSTMLDLCAGLLEPTEGAVRVVGAPAESVAARVARSYIPDHPVLYDDLTLWEHVAYVAGLHAAAGWEDVATGLLDVFRLSERIDDLPARFSRGMRQKVALVIGLVRPFSLLLVDEPFLGLDSPAQRALVELLVEAAGGAGLVVSTHQPNLVEVASRCVGLVDGELAYDGPADPEVIDRIVHG